MINDNKFKTKFLLVILFLSITSVSLAASDELLQWEEWSKEELTIYEIAVFGFFRLAGKAPDYEYWVTSKKYYDSVPEELKEDYLMKEEMRLGTKFGLYELEEDLLQIQTEVIAELTPPSEEEKGKFTFRFPEDNKTDSFKPAFAFSYGKDVIAISVDELVHFSDMKLSQTQYDRMLEKAPYPDDKFPVIVNIHIQPLSANYENPYINSETDSKQYVMHGKIGYIECIYQDYTKGGDVKLWDYLAPWHAEVFIRKKMAAENPENQYPHPYDLFKD